MGTSSVDILVSDPQMARTITLEALVDTGCTYTVVPAHLLRDLGVRPHTSGEFILADGSVMTHEIGRTWVEVQGQREFTLVVFGPDDAEPLLGAVTMEEIRLTPDVVAGELIPVRGLMK